MSATRTALNPILVAALLGLGLPALVAAQAPPGGDDSQGAADTQGASSGPPALWRLRVEADGTWYSNAYFLGTTSEDAAWSTNGRLTLSRDRRFRTGNFSLSAYGGAIYYPEIDSFNQPTYGGSFDLNWQAARHTKLTLGQRYDRTSTRYLQASDAAGLPLPTSIADYATTTASLDQQLARYWVFALDGTFAYRHYDNDQLVNSEQVYANARLGHQVGPQGQVYLRYGYSSSWFGPEKQRSHELLLGGRRSPPGRGTGFDLAAGVAYVESSGKFYPAGNVGIHAVGRRAQLDLAYRRDFGQAYGYGQQTIGDLVDGRLTWTPVRRLGFDAGYNFGRRVSPTDESYTIRSSIASAGFNWDIGAGFAFGTHYYWERNETTGYPLVEDSRVTGSLSYGVDWR